MKAVYQIGDGSIHETVESALDREELLKRVSNVRKLLPQEPKHSGSGFSNGDGYYQLTAQEINTYRLEVRKLIEDIHHRDVLRAFDENQDGIVGRILNDCDSPVSPLQYVFSCIDDDNRMWGQPYFAYVKERGKNINLRK